MEIIILFGAKSADETLKQIAPFTMTGVGAAAFQLGPRNSFNEKFFQFFAFECTIEPSYSRIQYSQFHLFTAHKGRIYLLLRGE